MNWIVEICFHSTHADFTSYGLVGENPALTHPMATGQTTKRVSMRSNMYVEHNWGDEGHFLFVFLFPILNRQGRRGRKQLPSQFTVRKWVGYHRHFDKFHTSTAYQMGEGPSVILFF